MHTIWIAQWIANGLTKYLQEPIVFLINEGRHVCLISETHFTKEAFAKLKGYQIHHTIQSSNKARGGSPVIIKVNTLHCEDFKIEEDCKTSNNSEIHNERVKRIY